jgi:hypothetical protein
VDFVGLALNKEWDYFNKPPRALNLIFNWKHSRVPEDI